MSAYVREKKKSESKVRESEISNNEIDFLMGNQCQAKEVRKKQENVKKKILKEEVKKNILLEMLLATVYDNAIRD